MFFPNNFSFIESSQEQVFPYLPNPEIIMETSDLPATPPITPDFCKQWEHEFGPKLREWKTQQLFEKTQLFGANTTFPKITLENGMIPRSPLTIEDLPGCLSALEQDCLFASNNFDIDIKSNKKADHIVEDIPKTGKFFKQCCQKVHEYFEPDC